MTEPAVLILRQPVKLAPNDPKRARAFASADRFQTAKARDSFQPVEQILAQIDGVRQKYSLA